MSLIKNPFVRSKVSAAALICFIMFQAATDAGKVSKLIFLPLLCAQIQEIFQEQ